MYFLRQLKKFNLPQELLIQFYTATVQSVLCTPIIVWFGSATKQDRNRLKRTIRTAERIIGVNLPSIQDLYTSRVRKRAGKISADPSHPGHNLFELLPSGRRYRTMYTNKCIIIIIIINIQTQKQFLPPGRHTNEHLISHLVSVTP